MPQLCLILLLSIQTVVDTSSVELLYHQQQVLLEQLAETVKAVEVIARSYEVQGLAETTEYSQLSEQLLMLRRTLDVTRAELGTLSPTAANADVLRQLEAIQTRLLTELGRSAKHESSTDVRQHRAHQRGEALQEIDDLLRRQDELLTSAGSSQQSMEAQQKIAADTSTAMLELSQRSPDVAKQLQRALQSMRLAERKLHSDMREQAADHQRKAMQQLKQARRALQQYLADTAEQNTESKAVAQLPLVSELARAQTELEQRINTWDRQTPPPERLRALHQQRSLSRQLGQLRAEDAEFGQELGDATESMQQAVEALTNGNQDSAQQSMRQSVQALQAMEAALMQQAGLPNEAAAIAQMVESVASGSDLTDAVRLLEQFGVEVEDMPGNGSGDRTTGHRSMEELRWSVHQKLMDALHAQLGQEQSGPQTSTPGAVEFLTPTKMQATTDEREWKVDLGTLKQRLDQAMKLPSAEQYGELLREYFTEIAEQPR